MPKDIPTFVHVRNDKEQALKVLEEAAEVFGAWQLYDQRRAEAERLFRAGLDCPTEPTAYAEALDDVTGLRAKVLEECADVVQATCNLMSAFGVEDARALVAECIVRNEGRGRKYR